MNDKKTTHSTWRCECCHTQTTINTWQGRPHGGSCGGQPRDSKGKYKPHKWVKIGER